MVVPLLKISAEIPPKYYLTKIVKKTCAKVLENIFIEWEKSNIFGYRTL